MTANPQEYGSISPPGVPVMAGMPGPAGGDEEARPGPMPLPGGHGPYIAQEPQYYPPGPSWRSHEVASTPHHAHRQPKPYERPTYPNDYAPNPQMRNVSAPMPYRIHGPTPSYTHPTPQGMMYQPQHQSPSQPQMQPFEPPMNMTATGYMQMQPYGPPMAGPSMVPMQQHPPPHPGHPLPPHAAHMSPQPNQPGLRHPQTHAPPPAEAYLPAQVIYRAITDTSPISPIKGFAHESDYGENTEYEATLTGDVEESEPEEERTIEQLMEHEGRVSIDSRLFIKSLVNDYFALLNKSSRAYAIHVKLQKDVSEASDRLRKLDAFLDGKGRQEEVDALRNLLKLKGPNPNPARR